ncbi:hypothetical protein [Moorena sp. SIO3I8]|nr:hypothetical protein [Moorena sp. SIO3I8]
MKQARCPCHQHAHSTLWSVVSIAPYQNFMENLAVTSPEQLIK